MQAVVMRAFGAPEVLRLEEIDTPEPGPDDALVRVEAVSVNRTLDLAVRAGTYPRPVSLPHILGADPTGTIAAVGRNVRDRRVGDAVAVSARLTSGTSRSPPVMLGVQAWGGYAQFVRVPAAATHVLPDGLDFVQATIVARHAPLAFNMLRAKARVAEGEWVVVMGATGGLGGLAVQVARHLGARVIAVGGGRSRVDACLDLGAEAAIDHRTEDITERVRAITGGHGADVVLENVGVPELFPKALKSMARNGRMVTAGAHGGGQVELDLQFLYLNYITIVGSTAQTREDVDDALRAAAAGKLKGVVSDILPLSRAAEAHRRMEDRALLGKIILRPDHS